MPTARPMIRMTTREMRPSAIEVPAKPEAMPVANGLVVDASVPIPAPSRITATRINCTRLHRHADKAADHQDEEGYVNRPIQFTNLISANVAFYILDAVHAINRRHENILQTLRAGRDFVIGTRNRRSVFDVISP